MSTIAVYKVSELFNMFIYREGVSVAANIPITRMRQPSCLRRCLSRPRARGGSGGQLSSEAVQAAAPQTGGQSQSCGDVGSAPSTPFGGEQATAG